MKIVRAVAADLEVLVGLEDESGWSRAAIEDELMRGRGWVARMDERALGFCFVRDFAGELWLMRVVVAPAARRRGVARALLAVALEGEVWLEVAEDNLAALSLYTSLGFVEQGRRARYYRAPDRDAIVMIRRGACES